MICNKDCENCPYPDCINDEFTTEDMADVELFDRRVDLATNLRRKGGGGKFSGVYKTTEKQRANNRRYQETHKERVKLQHAEWYQRNKNRVAMAHKAYYHRIKGAHPERAEALKAWQAAQGYTCKQAAEVLGISLTWYITIRNCNPAPSVKLLAKIGIDANALVPHDVEVAAE